MACPVRPQSVVLVKRAVISGQKGTKGHLAGLAGTLADCIEPFYHAVLPIEQSLTHAKEGAPTTCRFIKNWWCILIYFNQKNLDPGWLPPFLVCLFSLVCCLVQLSLPWPGQTVPKTDPAPNTREKELKCFPVGPRKKQRKIMDKRPDGLKAVGKTGRCACPRQMGKGSFRRASLFSWQIGKHNSTSKIVNTTNCM